MALRIEYETNFGITCEYAICVVVDARCNKYVLKEKDENGDVVITKTFPIEYNGKIYASDDAYADGASPVGGFNGNFLMSESAAKTQYNIVKQCYVDLKTQDGFTDGVDC
tara:strand:+ start:1181 stop:1510 length:330 start_codon:yes stop_codon:yes gene_type:complete